MFVVVVMVMVFGGGPVGSDRWVGGLVMFQVGVISRSVSTGSHFERRFI